MSNNLLSLKNYHEIFTPNFDLRISANGYQPQRTDIVKMSHTSKDVKVKSPPKKP